MIIGLEGLIIPVGIMLLGCPMNKASVYEPEYLSENGLSGKICTFVHGQFCLAKTK